MFNLSYLIVSYFLTSVKCVLTDPSSLLKTSSLILVWSLYVSGNVSTLSKGFDICSRQEAVWKVNCPFLGISIFMKNFKSIYLCKCWPAFSVQVLMWAEYLYLWLYIYVFRNALYSNLEIFQHSYPVGTCSGPSWRITYPYPCMFICLLILSCLLCLRFIKGWRESSHKP